MTIDELLRRLAASDIRLRTSEQELIVLGDQEALDTVLVGELRSHKATLFALIGGDSDLWWSPPIAITPEMLPLVKLTEEEIRRIVREVPGGATNVQDIYPLAPLQQGILFHHLMGGEGDPYLLASLFSFDSRARVEKYLGALQAVIGRHDILRTAVLWEGLPEPVQVVWRKAVLSVEEVAMGPVGGDAAAQLYARFNPRRFRIDVRQAPLLRVYIAHDAVQDRWLMMQLLHHLAGDHSTLDVMQEEIEAHLLGEAERLPRPQPFRNVVAQARLGISEEEHEVFFRKLLGDIEEPTAPFGLLDVQGDGSGIEEARRIVEAGLAGRIREQARKLGLSAASLCHVAWAQVLARMTGREDVVFGTVLFGRMQGGAGADRVMGLFINTLPIRIRIGEEGVEGSVRRTHALLGDLLHHEHASLALAQRCSRVPAPAPLFSALLNYRHSRGAGQAPTEERMPAWEGMRGLYGEERTNYPFTLSVDDLGEGFGLTAQVEASVGAERVCNYMSTALESLVEALEKEPTRATSTLAVLPAEERRQVLYEWNRTEVEYAGDKCIHELFEEQVGKTPEAVAVVFEEESQTYAELNGRANRLGHYLRGLGVKPDTRVAICMERGFGMIEALLGVLKAGGAYVPLDAAYPVERLRYMLEDSGAAVLLTGEDLKGLFPGLREDLRVLDVEGDKGLWEEEPETNLDCGGMGLTPEHLAYVIYTSGSTGAPKGVMVEHRSSQNLIWWYVQEFGLTRVDEVPLLISFSFDAALKNILGPLAVGGRLYLAREPFALPAIRRLVSRTQIGLINLTPSAMQMFIDTSIDGKLSNIRQVLLGGEPLQISKILRVAEPRPAFSNLYGPTECADIASCYVLPKELDEYSIGPVCIGRPIANTRIYVLDGRQEPVPVGVAGELYIGGAGVARGYLNRPELTAERFLRDPFAGDGSGRMYRTGDVGRWLADGNIEFLGRNDFQVKIRGFRIELGEIEARLAEQDGVREAVVIAREDTAGEKRLVAYYTWADATGGGPGAEELRAYLLSKLPEYMVPAAYVRLESLPLTPNGKLDRKALPAPEADAYGRHGYEAPVGEMETAIAAIWAETLQLERVGRSDDFFDLGGHSLSALHVMMRLQESFEVEVAMSDLFTHSVLASLAGHMIDLQLDQFDPEDLAAVRRLMENGQPELR